jgi:D-aspartate ligase
VGDRVGAVVVGGDYQGLGIVRSLGRHGVPVCVVDDERSIAGRSRYCTHAVHVDSLRDQDTTLQCLLNVGRRLGLEGWVLFPTREETVAAFARHRDLLKRQFRVPTPEWSTVVWAWDKRETYRLAEHLGIATPRTWYLSSDDGLAQVDGEPPFAIKPAIKEHFFYATGQKAWRADSREQLAELIRRASALLPKDELIVQEVIPGGGAQQYSYCAFFKDGHAVGHMTARRLRQHPLQFGRASTYVETVDIPELDDPSERLLRTIEYYGLVELEYKLDERDGRFKLLDFNARTWGYHTLGAKAGVDFPFMLYQDQLGQSVEPRRAAEGTRWVRLLTDLPTGLVELRDGRLDWRSYVRSLRTADVEAVFAGDDPVPGLMEVALLPYLAVTRGF